MTHPPDRTLPEAAGLSFTSTGTLVAAADGGEAAPVAHNECRSDWTGLVFASLGSIAFSGKAIIVKLAYRHDVDAITLIMYRMLFALPLFALLAWWGGRGQAPLVKRDWIAIVLLGFSGYYLASTLDFAGLAYISAGLERLVLYLNPTLVLGLGALLFKRRVTRAQLGALALSYCGVWVVFGHELLAPRLASVAAPGSSVALGAGLVFASAASYALYLVYSQQEVKRIGALRLTGLATGVACLLCIAQFAVLRPLSAAIVAPEVIWLSVLNATLCTFAPVLMTMLAIERIGAGISAQVGMIGPISTIVMGALVLDEPFTVWMMAGTVLVMAGIWALTRFR